MNSVLKTYEIPESLETQYVQVYKERERCIVRPHTVGTSVLVVSLLRDLDAYPNGLDSRDDTLH